MGFDVTVITRVLPLLLRGTRTTLLVSGLGLALGSCIGLPVALARLSSFRVLRAPALLYVDFIRGTPLLVQIFAVFYVLPSIGLELTSFQSAVTALAINSGAYQAEIWRGGIQAVPRGQWESARSLGMSYGQCLWRIVLPQVAYNILPAFTNEVSTVIKGSSLVSVLAVIELTRVGQQLVASLFHPIEIYVSVALVYLTIHLVLSNRAYYLERRLGVYREAGVRRGV